tara:strand:+ start:1256 stop:1837 length:582 start_codon:yes stop_codon:yes gene_type:complete
MNGLLLCSKVLYDKDILDKMEILKKQIDCTKIKKPKIFFNTVEEWDAKKNIIFTNVEINIKDQIMYNRVEYESMKTDGITQNQWLSIGNNIEKILFNLTKDKKWSVKVTWDLMHMCSMLFFSLISSETWLLIYEILSKNQLASIVYNLIRNKLDDDILLDIATFKCTKCNKISSNIYSEDNICFECKFIIVNS